MEEVKLEFVKQVYPMLIALAYLACSNPAQQNESKTTSENLHPTSTFQSFSGQPIEYSADSDTVYLTLKGENGELINLWSILSEKATPQQYIQIISNELTDEDPSEAHKVFHVAYLDLDGTNYFYMLAGQIGDVRYAERLIDFRSYQTTSGGKAD